MRGTGDGEGGQDQSRSRTASRKSRHPRSGHEPVGKHVPWNAARIFVVVHEREERVIQHRNDHGQPGNNDSDERCAERNGSRRQWVRQPCYICVGREVAGGGEDQGGCPEVPGPDDLVAERPAA